MNDNKLIAEFMSGEHPLAEVTHEAHHNYDTSWDWLIPVAQKLEGDGLDPHELINEALWRSPLKIEDLYNEVVDAIKRYNNESYFLCGSCGERCSEYTYSEDRDVDECNDCKTSNNEEKE